MIEKFNTYEWHDAIVSSVVIDRSNPGVVDVVKFMGSWPDGRPMWLEFSDVYLVQISMNMGIISDESIRDASFSYTSETATRYKEKIKRQGLDAEVFECKFEFASTASTVVVVACGISIV